jgi:hypothetical protein
VNGSWAQGQADEPADDDETLAEVWYDQPRGTPLLARGMLWSDLVAEIERDNELRDAA